MARCHLYLRPEQLAQFLRQRICDGAKENSVRVLKREARDRGAELTEFSDLPLVLVTSRAVPTVADEKDDDPGLLPVRQFLQPERERVRLELRGDREQHTITGLQETIDPPMQHVLKAPAALFEAPFDAERGIVQNGM